MCAGTVEGEAQRREGETWKEKYLMWAVTTPVFLSLADFAKAEVKDSCAGVTLEA